MADEAGASASVRVLGEVGVDVDGVAVTLPDSRRRWRCWGG
jgi:hypothetical protein